MKSSLSISVIIPCFNSEKTIKACLDSVFSQSAHVNEIIVIDDGSIDASTTIINETFQMSNSNIKCVLEIQANAGPSTARNRGVMLAMSNHIAFLDSDDQWYQDHISISKQFLEENNNYKMVATKYSSGDVKFSGVVSFEQLLLKNYFLTPCVILNKDCFYESGGFNVDMRYAEDYYLWLDIAYKNKVYLLDYIGAQNVEFKKPFGDKGLSSNLRAMHLGVIQCYDSLYQKRQINYKKYYILKQFEHLKYIRRNILTLLMKK
ncbi:glycosyltransferase family 2 protein [Flavobacterium frigidarium]|uniref:glycosyltransferase family 2 protein n=1 Tax=Flavobacterium frigidarium TaxID=99286 RepID=UPI0004288746|nr:glycosyltransferase family A protein [Flavobacterium frigidarium]